MKSFEYIIIDTGTRAAVPPLEGVQQVPYLDSTSIMELGEVPEHLLVIGGGYIGLEFGQMFRRFGSKVTIVHQPTPQRTLEVRTPLSLRSPRAVRSERGSGRTEEPLWGKAVWETDRRAQGGAGQLVPPLRRSGCGRQPRGGHGQGAARFSRSRRRRAEGVGRRLALPWREIFEEAFSHRPLDWEFLFPFDSIMIPPRNGWSQ